MTYQRQRGTLAKIYKVKKVANNRGTEVKLADPTDFHEVKVWQISQRSARAEVDGQQHINVIRIGTKANLEEVELWSQVELNGKHWDVVTPPAFHNGSSRATRHWSMDLRERP